MKNQKSFAYRCSWEMFKCLAGMFVSDRYGEKLSPVPFSERMFTAKKREAMAELNSSNRFPVAITDIILS